MIAISLAAYDLDLKAEYKKGDYTNPYRDYTSLDYRDFDEIELDASTAANLIITQGPYKILVNPGAHDFLHVSKLGRRLVIKAAFPDHYRAFTSEYMICVSCPKLLLLKTDARYTAGGTQVTDTVANDLRWKPTLLTGFKLDSLDIRADHGSNIVLENDRIGYVGGTIGADENSGPALTIGPNNHFDKSNLDLLNKSRLIIKGAGTPNLTYRLADSATLMINGVAAKYLLNLK
ncbi:MAG TPA: hypothetical protein VHC47_08810 [Mucilaginibacter sp.]|nr:hypothetical protein [Mucilaginibacter sp.]